ncbi:MAG: hypothetical protein WCP34_15990 [Pseudomonadota bacterium]
MKLSYPNLFKEFEPRHGKDWVKNLPEQDKRVFIEIGLQAAEHGHLGGIARAKTARRDHKGRFTKAGQR